jgi:hypothetical protein
MAGETDRFELNLRVDRPRNTFRVVHVYNSSDVYHLMRQVLLDTSLLDTSLTQNSNCLFYHILVMDVDLFNKNYASFACLIPRDEMEADLYMNVHPEAFRHLIEYLHTGKICPENINIQTLEKLNDMASMFGMSKLVEFLQKYRLDDLKINHYFEIFRHFVTNILTLIKNRHYPNLDLTYIWNMYETFVMEHRQEIVEQIIKPWHYMGTQFLVSFIIFLIKMFSLIYSGQRQEHDPRCPRYQQEELVREYYQKLIDVFGRMETLKKSI